MSNQEYTIHNFKNQFIKNRPKHDISELVTELPPCMSWIHLDSRDRQEGEKLNNINLSKRDGVFSLGNVIKMGLYFVQFEWSTPNINPRNNELTIVKNNVYHTYYLKTGFYTTEDFVTELNVAFNNMSPPLPSIPVASIGSNVDGRKITITTPEDYGIERTDTIRRNVWDLIGYERNKYLLSTSGQSSYPNLYYSRWVDIISSKLNTYQDVEDEGSSVSTSNMVIRIYSDDSSSVLHYPLGTEAGSPASRPHLNSFPLTHMKWFNWEHNTSLGTVIDLKLIDEFGDEFYIEDETKNYSLIFLSKSLY